MTIGILFAFLLNMFQDDRGEQQNFSKKIHSLEQQMQTMLTEISKYLSNQTSRKGLWRELASIETQLQECMEDAYEYEGNTYGEDATYFARYFEMRLNQCRILHNLQNEMQKIKDIPAQAQVVAEYISYLSKYVLELNNPSQQFHHLEEIFLHMKEEPLPVSRQEFESRAVLYHILMDLEDFLLEKKRFIDKEGNAPGF